MGRRAQGHQVKWKRGWAYVHFTHETVLYRIALGTKDPREASARAAHEHAAVVSGRRRKVVGARVGGTLQPFDVLLAEWIASLEGALDEQTLDTLAIYAKHYLAFFGTLERMTDASCADYGRARLRSVLRKTVQKELSYLRGFLAWCAEQGILVDPPTVAPLPKKATGKRAGKQRAKPVEVTEAQALAIVALLPKESKKIGDRKWPVRARYLAAWETGLRPESMARLRSPENYRRGATRLVLDDADDKARYGRELPLSEAARAALDAALAEPGLIFGKHNFNKVLKAAAAKVLGPELGAKFASYDFRHGRGTHLVDEGAPLTGVAYLLGHKRLSTTDKYLRPSLRAAERALAIGAPYPPPGDEEEEADETIQPDSRGDRRGSNPRHLEPQRRRIAKSVEDSAGSERPSEPPSTRSGQGIRTGCRNPDHDVERRFARAKLRALAGDEAGTLAEMTAIAVARGWR